VDGPAGSASAGAVCQRHEYPVQHRVFAGQRPAGTDGLGPVSRRAVASMAEEVGVPRVVEGETVTAGLLRMRRVFQARSKLRT
jgi:hypothetical protein